MNYQELITKVQNIIPPRKTKLIAIDGRGGSGKTTLSCELAQQLKDVTIIAMDDFYVQSNLRENSNPIYFNFNIKRLLREVILPLSKDETAIYQRYDWASDMLAEKHEVKPGGSVIIEGCYSMHTLLRDYYDFKIWIECDKELALLRGVSRDIMHEKGADHKTKMKQWKEDFQPKEDTYIDTMIPQTYADYVLEITQ